MPADRRRMDGSRLVTEDTFDFRKGTVRGFLAMLLGFSGIWAICFVFGALS